MAFTGQGATAYTMPKRPSEEIVDRMVRRGIARSSDALPAVAAPGLMPRDKPPVLAVDGHADGGTYLAASQNGRGGAEEEAGYKREARLLALRALDPKVRAKLQKLRAERTAGGGGGG